MESASLCDALRCAHTHRHDGPWESPTLRFSPTAWAKLLYLSYLGETEVGSIRISAVDDLPCVEDVQLVRQICTGL